MPDSSDIPDEQIEAGAKALLFTTAGVFVVMILSGLITDADLLMLWGM